MENSSNKNTSNLNMRSELNLQNSPDPYRCSFCDTLYIKTKQKKKQKCERCKEFFCIPCMKAHPQVLLPHLGLKIKQNLCPDCFAVICSKKSNFIIRDKDGHIYSTGKQLPDGLISVNSDYNLDSHIPRHSSYESLNEEMADHSDIPLPSLRIIIILVGSRGDVQPYIGFALKLIEEGHRIRIATHEHHREFVNRYNVEFFPIAGDPAELMEFMVENQLKSVQSFTNKITRHREWVQDLCTTSFCACTTSYNDKPYRSDVIIANPPSFVGIHLAEKFSIPLIMSFTMPWTATTEFCSPFVRTSGPKKNFLSYMVLDRMIWIGIRSIINNWRETDLNLAPVRTSNFKGHRLLYDKKVPYIYCFSEHLLPKPSDWGNWIGVAGFYFLDTKTNWNPPKEISDFLNAGEPPIFIGFGSIVVADPDALTECIMESVKLSGCRAIIQQGWAKITPKDIPDNVLLIGAAPHDWLFEHCSAVIHHGGAGTTSTGLRAGKPTIIVPFFGDQFFWGDTVARMKLGPEPVLYSSITPKKLSDAIKFALKPEIKNNAKECGYKLQNEKGIENGIQLFKQYLPVKKMICDTCPDHVPEFTCTDCKLNLCYTCNSIIHHRIENFLKHLQHRYQIVNWKHDNLWGSYINAIGDGGSTLTKNIGTGFVEAVNTVSNAEGIVGIVGGVGKSLFTFTGSIAQGTTKGIKKTVNTAITPNYPSGKRPRSLTPLRASDVDTHSSETYDLEKEKQKLILNAFHSQTKGKYKNNEIEYTHEDEEEILEEQIVEENKIIWNKIPNKKNETNNIIPRIVLSPTRNKLDKTI